MKNNYIGRCETDYFLSLLNLFSLSAPMDGFKRTHYAELVAPNQINLQNWLLILTKVLSQPRFKRIIIYQPHGFDRCCFRVEMDDSPYEGKSLTLWPLGTKLVCLCGVAGEHDCPPVPTEMAIYHEMAVCACLDCM